MAISPSKIIAVVIGLLLLGILLPIGLTEMTSFDLTDSVSSSSYTAQSPPKTYNLTGITTGQGINCSVTYNNSFYHLNVSVFAPGDTVNAKASSSTANATLFVEFNATLSGTWQIKVTSIGVGSPTFNATIAVTTFLDSDVESNIETLIGTVVPIVAVVGIILLLIPRTKNY